MQEGRASRPPVMGGTLLEADEPAPFLRSRWEGRSPFVIVADHAGRRIPRRLANLGLAVADLERHIAWDIGARAIAEHVSRRLDAPLISQVYSRLVIDCNRDPKVPTSIPALSEATPVPGNQDLGEDGRLARRREIFAPYHECIAALLDERAAAAKPVILVAQHTMTDVYHGVRRPMHAAVLYNRDRRFAGLVLDMLRRDKALQIADNEPYFVSDATDYTIPHHGERRGLPHVEIEVRQDLVRDAAGQAEWAERLADALEQAARRLGETA
ncbi:MAG TPA: N-formylglutamate amidohydrolase [Steroidobacteraceae bacterium]|nr:N-formylglutamate amidohydrolase [Steroidobacteraceae bacterium]